MEYSKDIIFNIKYNEINNVLSDGQSSYKWTSKIKNMVKKIKKNKMFFIITVACVTLIAIDSVLIFNFAELLQKSSILL